MSFTLHGLSTHASWNGQIKDLRFDLGTLNNQNIEIDHIRGRSLNQAPTLAPVSNATVSEGSTFIVQAFASDGDQNRLSYSLTTAPFGATISRAGRVSWPTTEFDGGRMVPFTARVSDGQLTASLSAVRRAGAGLGQNGSRWSDTSCGAAGQS